MGHTVGERSWKNLTFCVFMVVVKEKCYDAGGDGVYYFRSGCSVSEGASFLRPSIAVERKSIGHTVGEWPWKNVVFCVTSVAVQAQCFDACGTGKC
jgi:hypothetical protein